ncbi:hypothetical protein MKW92_030430 [Papaver armeniacum]|nr:hypothetical protein MKW92_030430 [Papaver armeniacum]
MGAVIGKLDICSGTWDFTCFVEHLCVSNIVRLLMVLGLCYIILMFIYLLFQLGIIQCVCRSLCKMCWFACRSYCRRNTRLHMLFMYRDIEQGYGSTEDSIERYRSLNVSRKENGIEKERLQGLITQ